MDLDDKHSLLTCQHNKDRNRDYSWKLDVKWISPVQNWTHHTERNQTINPRKEMFVLLNKRVNKSCDQPTISCIFFFPYEVIEPVSRLIWVICIPFCCCMSPPNEWICIILHHLCVLKFIPLVCLLVYPKSVLHTISTTQRPVRAWRPCRRRQRFTETRATE